MRIAVLSSHEHRLCFIDNDIHESLHFGNDNRHHYDGSNLTFDFAVSTKHPDSRHLQVGNKVAFKDGEHEFYLNIVSTEEDDYEKTVHCESLSLELLNESGHKLTGTMTFAGALSSLGAETTEIEIGINEIPDRQRTFDDSINVDDGTLLKAYYSLASIFDAEIQFRTELNQDYTLKRFVLDVCRKHSDEWQGIGQVRHGVIEYGNGIKGISRKADITELYTMLIAKGKETDEVALDLSSYPEQKIYDDNNILIFHKPAGNSAIYAPQARDRFPSTMSGSEGDRYILRHESWEYETQADLWAHALSEIRKASEPKVEYNVDGFVPGNVGDTVTIRDANFNPPLLVKCRIVEQEISITNPADNRTKLDNFTELVSQISEETKTIVQKLIDEQKRYTGEIISTGTILKKDMSTILTAKVLDGAKEIDEPIKWYKGDTFVSDEKSITVQWNDFEKSQKYHFEGEKVYAEVTVTTVYDGEKGDPGSKGDKGDPGQDVTATVSKANGVATVTITDKDGTKTFTISDGQDGADGVAGTPGTDGQTPYTHFAWANSSDGSTGFSTTVSAGKLYIGVYSDYTQADSTDKTKYKWTKIKGETGATGPAGADGKDVTASVTKANGTATVTLTDKNGTKTFTITDGQDGATGQPGTPGVNGQTSYTHFAWADSADGSTNFSTTASAGKLYMGVYSDFTQADSTDKTKYSWTKIKGETGSKGDKGDSGSTGPKGDTGLGVSAVKPQHYLSTSSTTQTGGSWGTAYPTFDKSKYLWTRFEITWSDSTTTNTTPVLDAQWIELAGVDDTLTTQGNTIALLEVADQSIRTWVGQNYVGNSTYNTQYSALTQTVSDFELSFHEELDGVNTKTQYFRFENGKGLWIGSDLSIVKLLLASDKISFVESDADNPPMWLQAHVVYFEKVEIRDQMRIGNMVWKVLTNGRWEIS